MSDKVLFNSKLELMEPVIINRSDRVIHTESVTWFYGQMEGGIIDKKEVTLEKFEGIADELLDRFIEQYKLTAKSKQKPSNK
ncbi:MAG: hypothetical protein ACHQYP_10955 [Nitrospiria bacterium]